MAMLNSPVALGVGWAALLLASLFVFYNASTAPSRVQCLSDRASADNYAQVAPIIPLATFSPTRELPFATKSIKPTLSTNEDAVPEAEVPEELAESESTAQTSSSASTLPAAPYPPPSSPCPSAASHVVTAAGELQPVRRRAAPPADDPPPASLIALVEAYREAFKDPQPTGAECRRAGGPTSYVYVNWYLGAGMGNRLPSTVMGAAIALVTGRRLILPSVSKAYFQPTFPVCYHDQEFGGDPGSPKGFPAAGGERREGVEEVAVVRGEKGSKRLQW